MLYSFIHKFNQGKTSCLSRLLCFWIWLKDLMFEIYWCFWFWEKHTIVKILIEGTFWVVFQHPFEIEVVFCEFQIWHWVLSKLFNSSIPHLKEQYKNLTCPIIYLYILDTKLWCNLSCRHHASQERTTFYNYFIKLKVIWSKVFSDELACLFRLRHTIWSQWRIELVLVMLYVICCEMFTMTNDSCKMVFPILLLIHVYSLHLRL